MTLPYSLCRDERYLPACVNCLRNPDNQPKETAEDPCQPYMKPLRTTRDCADQKLPRSLTR
jgi:hypothetical protein